jgi:integrase
MHRMEVPPEVAEVARRVLGRGKVSESALHKAIAKAAKDLGLGKVGPGMFRHTFATRMVESGASPESVAAYLHHRSTQTTMRFCATLGVITVPKPRLAVVSEVG